ncbi:hypothetical protein [Leptolyngbya ohadii]|uniref:hypothetical protein n=1 Tax=Leptolyngbya ohadii TaxID=1962290 RepID=UPI000B59D1A5|nr:hypothetical protein [Leptolyngbya ohadii]
MTFEEFLRSIQEADQPPIALSIPLQALWYDRRAGWQRAHTFLGDETQPDHAWVHAYLHRREGDLDNARYWYRKAKQPECTADLDREWQTIAQSLLEQ